MELLELMKPDRKAKERMERLRAIRVRLHGIASQRAFAARLGVSYSRYNNWEGAGYPIPEAEAKKIKDITPGITGDYILWGDIEGLTVEALKKLRADRNNQPA